MLASCSRRKSRLSVDSPGRFRMELHGRKAPQKVPRASLRLFHVCRDPYSQGCAPPKHLGTLGQQGWREGGATTIGAGQEAQCQVEHEFHIISPSYFFFLFFLNRSPEEDKVLRGCMSWQLGPDHRACLIYLELTDNLFAEDFFYSKFLTKVPCAAVARTIFSCSQSTFSMNHCQLLKYYIISGK